MHPGRAGLGACGEALAARYLGGLGWEIIEARWRPPFAPRLGEIDIVARDGGTIVLVEVRTRRGKSFGTPLESILGEKSRRLARLARAAVLAFGTDEIRIDAIGIECGGGKVRLRHARNAVDCR